MSKILIVAEHANGQLNPSTAKTLTAAKQMGAASIDIAVFAADPAGVAAQAAALDGVGRVLTIANAANANAPTCSARARPSART
jgi:electron transfer flavoprotein alpha subunit